MSEKEKQLGRTPANPNLLEREEARLWRVALLFVVLLATALAAVTWERLQALPYHLGLLPIAVLLVAISFAAFTYGPARLAEITANGRALGVAQLRFLHHQAIQSAGIDILTAFGGLAVMVVG